MTFENINNFKCNINKQPASLAQMHGALDYQSRGREFESQVGRALGVNIGVDEFTP